MKKFLVISIAALFVLSIVSASSLVLAKEPETKTGWITDTICKEKGAHAGHDPMKCVKEGGAKLAFYDIKSKTTFEIENPEKAEKLGGKEVALTGMFNTDKKTVKAERIMDLKKHAGPKFEKKAKRFMSLMEHP